MPDERFELWTDGRIERLEGGEAEAVALAKSILRTTQTLDGSVVTLEGDVVRVFDGDNGEEEETVVSLRVRNTDPV